jgi:hypothetical protein
MVSNIAAESREPGTRAAGAIIRPIDPDADVDVDQRAYSMNEFAIIWNAPLVFLLAAANS